MVLTMCDMLVARFVPGVESAGTDAELALAAQLTKEIIVVCGDREDVSDAMAWASPIVGGTSNRGMVTVEYAYLGKRGIETVSVISYDPVQEVAD